MKRIFTVALTTLVLRNTSILSIEQAQAQVQVITCYPYTYTEVIKNDANHPEAYSNGYFQGRKSALKGKKYQVRTAGGEFALGFEDGYYNRPFRGQKYVVPNRVNYYTVQNCNTYYSHQNNSHLEHKKYSNVHQNWLNQYIQKLLSN